MGITNMLCEHLEGFEKDVDKYYQREQGIMYCKKLLIEHEEYVERIKKKIKGIENDERQT